ncbi:hypothetical protein DFS34DRAFT_647733 [Phlyctochytrium arcticum]|nr:hypothetical protein DFS34DRAFT_647733 [Phlyctochytrium arcticum]
MQPGTLTMEELTKLLQDHKEQGFRSVKFLALEEHLAMEGKTLSASSASTSMVVAYASFVDMFCAKEAAFKLHTTVSLDAQFAADTDTANQMMSIPDRPLASGATQGARIDISSHSWISIVDHSPFDQSAFVAIGELRNELKYLNGFEFLSIEPHGVLAAFTSHFLASKALRFLRNETRLVVEHATKENLDGLSINPAIVTPRVAPNQRLHITFPSCIEKERFAGIFQTYDGFKKVVPLKSGLGVEFDTTQAAEHALNDLSKTTNLGIQFWTGVDQISDSASLTPPNLAKGSQNGVRQSAAETSAASSSDERDLVGSKDASVVRRSASAAFRHPDPVMDAKISAYIANNGKGNDSNNAASTSEGSGDRRTVRRMPSVAISGGKTLYVTLEGRGDKADLTFLCRTLPGFERIQYMPTRQHCRVLFETAENANHAIEVFNSKQIRSQYSHRSVDFPEAQNQHAPSRKLYLVTQSLTERELFKLLKPFAGIQTLEYIKPGSAWAIFKNIDTAVAAAGILNKYTSTCALYSPQKDLAADQRASITRFDKPQSQTSGGQEQTRAGSCPSPTGSASPTSGKIVHAWEVDRSANSSTRAQSPPASGPMQTQAASSPKTSVAQINGVSPNAAKVAHAGNGDRSSTSPMRPRSPPASRTILNSQFVAVASSENAEHFPVQGPKVDVVPAIPTVAAVSNIVIIRNSMLHTEKDLREVLEDNAKVESVHAEKSPLGSGQVWYVAFADCDSAGELLRSEKKRDAMGRGYGGVNFQYCSAAKVPAVLRPLYREE